MIESIEQGLSVERTLELTAPVDRVWRALTDPEELARWFPDRVDQAEVTSGVDGRFVWEKHGSFAFRLEAVEPPRRLVWRWARVLTPGRISWIQQAMVRSTGPPVEGSENSMATSSKGLASISDNLVKAS